MVSDPDPPSLQMTVNMRKLGTDPPLPRLPIALRRQGPQFESAWGHFERYLVSGWVGVTVVAAFAVRGNTRQQMPVVRARRCLPNHSDFSSAVGVARRLSRAVVREPVPNVERSRP